MQPHRRPILVASILLVPILFAAPAVAEEWSRFRGPNGSGVSASTGLPADLNEQNTNWEVDVPFGRSSPVIAKNRIFLTAIEDDKLVTLALERSSGKTVWRAELARARSAEFHTATDSATPTPVTDGSNVYSFFQEGGLVSYDKSGKQRWNLEMGPFRNFYGMASSPVLSGKRLFLLCDQAEGSFLLALNKDSGKELWRRSRPGRAESYSTPVLYPANKPHTLIVYGSRFIDAYDPSSGESLWTLTGVGAGPVSSPVVVGDTLYVHSPDHGEEGWAPFAGMLEEHDADKNGSLSKSEVESVWLAEHFGWLDHDANGEISTQDWETVGREMATDEWGVFAVGLAAGKNKPVKTWNYRKNVPNIPTSVIYDDVFYMVEKGIVTSLNPASGELLKRDRLEESSPKVYASPVAADGKIYIGTLDGNLTVLRAAGEWEVLSSNDLGDEIWASPAIFDGHIYVRTKGKLYDFAASSGNAMTEGSR